MKTTSSPYFLFYAVLLVLCLSPFAVADPVEAAIRTVRQVQVEGEGSPAAASAWKTLATAPPNEIPRILVAMKEADPIVANWFASAVDVAFQNAQKESEPLPLESLESLILDSTQSGQGRALTYDWLCRVDPSYRERLLPKLLTDPYLDLSQKAVQFAIEQTEALEKSGADPSDVIAAYQKTFEAARDLDQLRDLAARLEKLGKKVDLAAQLGLIVDWHIVGPFDGSGDDGFARVFPPEVQKQDFTFEETYEGKPEPNKEGGSPSDETLQKPRTVRWIEHHTDDPIGKVNLNQLLGEEKGVVAYAVTTFVSDRDQDVELRMVSRNGLRVWLDGQSIAVFEFYHVGEHFDLFRVKTKLRKGKNTILLKIHQNEQTQDWAKDWGYRFRVCNPLGYGITSEDR